MKRLAIVVLDASGSMSGQEARVVEGVNAYIDGLKKNAKKKVHIRIFEFDSVRWNMIRKGTTEDFDCIPMNAYQVGLSTPLYDSIARAIDFADSSGAEKVSIIIDTDGYENASQEHTQSSIQALVENRKKIGWDFEFIGTGNIQSEAQAVTLQASQLGMKGTATMHTSRTATYGNTSISKSSYFNG